VGKGNSFVGTRESLEESRMENGQAPGSMASGGKGKDKGKAREGEDEFSWD
jgi:hypothetical protein